MKTLVSFPSSRKNRFNLKKEYIDFKSDAISHIKNNNLFHNKNINYPDVKLTFLQKKCWNILCRVNILFQLDLNIRNYNKYKLFLYKIIKNIFILKFIDNLFTNLIIIIFKNKDYDEIVKNYDNVEIFTFYYVSEIYLFSSAIRNKKFILFSIDGWDIYEKFWIPSKINQYESWGSFFDNQLIRKGIKKENIIRRMHPFRIFEKKSEKYITIYESATRAVNSDLQLNSIKIINKYAKENQKKILVKTLHESNLEIHLKGVDNIDIYRTRIEYTDHGRITNEFVDEIKEIIPYTSTFISFGLSHGLIEYGINNIPVICIQDKIWETQEVLRKNLELSGVIFVNINYIILNNKIIELFYRSKHNIKNFYKIIE